MGKCTRRGVYGHRKVMSKINEEIYSKVEDRFCKQELQM